MKTEEVEALAKVWHEAMEKGAGERGVMMGLPIAGLEAVARAVRAQDAARSGTLTDQCESFAVYHDKQAGHGGVGWEFHARAATFCRDAGRTIAALTLERDSNKAGWDDAIRERDEARAAAFELATLRKVRALTAERDRLMSQGQADHRAIHDALKWAHDWHGKDLPSPWRGVLALIAERDRLSEHVKATIGGPFDPRVVLLSGGLNLPEWEARARRAESALHQCVSALDGLLGDSDGPDDDRPGVKAMQAAMAALNATPAEHPDTASVQTTDVMRAADVIRDGLKPDSDDTARRKAIRGLPVLLSAIRKHPDTATLRAIYERLDAWYDGRVPAEVLRSEKATWRYLRGDSGPSGGGDDCPPCSIGRTCVEHNPSRECGCVAGEQCVGCMPTTPPDVATGEHLDGCIEVETSPNGTGWSCDSGCPANPLNFERSRRSAASEPKPTPEEDWRTMELALNAAYQVGPDELRESLESATAALARLKARFAK